MSSRRSRSGGQRDRDDVRGGRRGPRGTRPPAPSRSRSRFVAATTRTSTRRGCARRRRGSNSPLLQHAQQLRLQRERQLADLVEEERAAVGAARSGPRACSRRAGERAAHVAEELALEQRLRDRRAVDRHERAARARGCASWMARATSSLPVPVSPRMSTVRAVGATQLDAADHLVERPTAPHDSEAAEVRTDERRRKQVAVVADNRQVPGQVLHGVTTRA